MPECRVRGVILPFCRVLNALLALRIARGSLAVALCATPSSRAARPVITEQRIESRLAGFARLPAASRRTREVAQGQGGRGIVDVHDAVSAEEPQPHALVQIRREAVSNVTRYGTTERT